MITPSVSRQDGADRLTAEGKLQPHDLASISHLTPSSKVFCINIGRLQ